MGHIPELFWKKTFSDIGPPPVIIYIFYYRPLTLELSLRFQEIVPLLFSLVFNLIYLTKHFKVESNNVVEILRNVAVIIYVLFLTKN